MLVLLHIRLCLAGGSSSVLVLLHIRLCLANGSSSTLVLLCRRLCLADDAPTPSRRTAPMGLVWPIARILARESDLRTSPPA